MHYVKTAANDGMMSLLNAYLAWKFDVTNGFSIKQPQNMRFDIANSGVTNDVILGYVPNMFGKSG
jgi:hypothetical protein